MDVSVLVAQYLAARPYTRDEVCARPGPIPPAPGVYGWWFRALPADIDTSRCEHKDGLTLLYAGISPSRPPANGKRPSQQNIRMRIVYHFGGNAEGSTLRKTLGLNRPGSDGNAVNFDVVAGQWLFLGKVLQRWCFG